MGGPVDLANYNSNDSSVPLRVEVMNTEEDRPVQDETAEAKDYKQVLA